MLSLCPSALAAQQTSPSYWYDRGENSVQDVFPVTDPPDGTSDPGEFAEDLGGHIPFGAFLNPNHPLFYFTLQADVFDHFTDLPALDAAIQAGRPGSDANLSLLQEGVPGSLVQLLAGDPVPIQTWWGLNAQLWRYKVNGGYANLV